MLKPIKQRPNGEILCLCEQCSDTKGRFCVNLQKKWVYCLRCGHNRPLTVVDTLGWVKKNIMGAGMAPHSGVKKTPTTTDDDGKRMIRLHPCPDSPLAKKTFDYAVQRGLDPVTLPLYYSPDIPYYLIIKQSNWWQGRTIKEGVIPKNLFSRFVDKSAMYIIKPPTSPQEVVIVEGIFDAEALRSKSRMVISLLGSVIKPEQKIKLCNLLRGMDAKVKILLDSDAREKSRKLYLELSKCLFNEVVDINWGAEEGDPDSNRTAAKNLLALT